MALETERARIRARIAKLLALAASPERHEAAAARRQASALAERHGIDLGALGEPEPADEASAPFDRMETPYGDVVWSAAILGRHDRIWRKVLLREVASIYGATVVVVGGRTWHVVGPRGGVDATVYLYRLFSAAIVDVARPRTRKAPRDFVQGLYRGLVRGVVDGHREARRRYLARLRRNAKRGDAIAKDALARIEHDPRALAYVARRRFGASKRTIQGRAPRNPDAYVAGYAAGRRAARAVATAADGGTLPVPERRSLPCGPRKHRS